MLRAGKGGVGVVAGLVVDGTGFEVLAGDRRIGSRRAIADADVTLLTELAQRYVRAVQANSDASVFLEIGRELYRWLDGDQRQLSALLDRAVRPLVFEVQAPRTPNDKAWAVLRAPFELLAPPDGGLLAEDALSRFAVVRASMRGSLLKRRSPSASSSGPVPWRSATWSRISSSTCWRRLNPVRNNRGRAAGVR